MKPRATATLGEILAASRPDPRTLPPIVRYYAPADRYSAAHHSIDGIKDDWTWADKAARKER